MVSGRETQMDDRAIVDRSSEPELDPLIRRHLDEVAMRMASALVRPTSVAGIME